MIARYGLDAVRFAREVLRFDPDEQQARVLDPSIRRGILNCCRQWGKSTLMAVKADVTEEIDRLTAHIAAARLEPHMRLLKVDTEANSELGARYNIRSIPTLALFQNGREVARQPGAMDTGGIVAWAEGHVRQQA